MKFDLKRYKKACLSFAMDTQEWSSLPNDKNFTSFGSEWLETPDNAHHGIHLEWAYKKDPDFVEENHERFFRSELKAAFEQILDEYDDLDLDQISDFISDFC